MILDHPSSWNLRGCQDPHRASLGGPHLTCGDTAVGVQAQDGIGADGAVWDEAVTGLQGEGVEGSSAVGPLPRLPW